MADVDKGGVWVRSMMPGRWLCPRCKTIRDVSSFIYILTPDPKVHPNIDPQEPVICCALCMDTHFQRRGVVRPAKEM